MKQQQPDVGGMGTMDAAIAAKMVKAGLSMTIYTRTMEKTLQFRKAGVLVAHAPNNLFAWADIFMPILAGPGCQSADT